jgi:thymidylate synthase ThyX
MTEPRVLVVDHLPPEDVAMLQALYSRSAESVSVHLDKVAQTGSGQFMSRWYVGYGHQSIGDCGTTTLFLEGVSLLAAKAIQDWPLYSGQETSTRYIDMSRQDIVDPIGTPESRKILDRWMSFYVENQDRVAATVRDRYPRRPDEKPEVYERAVKARVYDVLRGFLPAGITTQLSWHTNLRQANDHLQGLLHHPSEEVRKLAEGIRDVLAKKYPSSGFDRPANARRNEWLRLSSNEKYVYPMRAVSELISTISPFDLIDVEPLLRNRPRGAVLPHYLSDLGQLKFGFDLDYGSFRDLQRHRNGVCRMPLLTTALGFEPWYIDQLDPDLQNVARDLIHDQTEALEALEEDLVALQYLTALGFRVPCEVTYGLPAAVYVLELRSSRTVHPTLRKRILEMVTLVEKQYPQVVIYPDTTADDWDVRRGTQTITERT